MTKNQEKSTSLPSISKKIGYSLIALAVFAIIVISVYIINFGVIPYLKYEKLGLSSDSGDWGTFGDYIGGLLNPCIALFALYWLTSSIKTQIKELTETREQFEKISQNQLEQTSLQNFESLFFQLLETKDKAIKDILLKNQQDINSILLDETTRIANNNWNNYSEYTSVLYSNDIIEKILPDHNENISGKESIRIHMIIFKSLSNVKWQDFYTKLLLDYMGNYFRICYQIVKLIEKNELLSKNQEKDKKTDLQKKYFDIFRATLTQYELEAFFFNCLSDYGNQKFKKMIEDYGLFEPLLIDTNKDFEEIHRLTRYAYMYNKKSFENNEMFINYFSEIEKIKNVNFEKIRNEMYLMYYCDIVTFSANQDNNKILIEDFFANFEKYIFRYKFDYNAKNYFKNSIKFWNDKIINYEKQITELNENLVEYYNEKESKKKEWQDKITHLNISIDYAKNTSYKEEIDIIIKYRINISEFFSYHQLNKI